MPVSFEDPQFTASYQQSAALFARYQMAVHGDEPSECSESEVLHDYLFCTCRGENFSLLMFLFFLYIHSSRNICHSWYISLLNAMSLWHCTSVPVNDAQVYMPAPIVNLAKCAPVHTSCGGMRLSLRGSGETEAKHTFKCRH